MAQAWTELQGRHPNWRWMRSAFTCVVGSATDDYGFGDCTDSNSSTLISRFSHWIPFDEEGCPNLTIYLTTGGAAGERYMSYISWSQFRHLYRRGAQNNGQPAHFAISPTNALVIGPKPDANYTLVGEYQKGPQILALDDDVPELPSQYHQLIVFEAMRKHAGAKSKPEVMARAVTEGNRLLRQLEINQLPPMMLAPPLA